jgi:hypothetical protein
MFGDRILILDISYFIELSNAEGFKIAWSEYQIVPNKQKFRKVPNLNVVTFQNITVWYLKGDFPDTIFVH